MPEATYTEILKNDGNVIGARRQLVALLIDAGDFESARNVVTAGIALSPRNYQLYQDYVMIDLKSTGIDAALATADRLQSQDRDFAGIRALKGDIYLAANRPADAVTAYTDANNAAPSSLLVTRLAGALLRAGRADDATKLLLDWLGKHADDMVATEQVAEIDIATGKFDDAAKYLEMLLKQKPHDPVALNNLAWVYQQQGNDAKAQALARQAYVLAPSPQTADTLGWILTTSGNAQSGVALLRQASGDGDSRSAYPVPLRGGPEGHRQQGRGEEAVAKPSSPTRPSSRKRPRPRSCWTTWRRAPDPDVRQAAPASVHLDAPGAGPAMARRRRHGGRDTRPDAGSGRTTTPPVMMDARPPRLDLPPIRLLTFSPCSPTRRGRTTASSWRTGCATCWRAARPPASVLAPVPWFPSRVRPVRRLGPACRARRRRKPATASPSAIRAIRSCPKLGMSAAPWLLYRAMLPQVARLLAEGHRFDADRRPLRLSRRRRRHLARAAASACRW